MVRERLAVIAVLVAIAGVCVAVWAVPVDFKIGATWEEDAMFYIVGKNLVDLGFWRTMLLDDYAVGSDPAVRPMLYTHFPTISGLAQGLLQKAGISSIRGIRLAFVPVFLLGLLYLYGVARRLFSPKVALILLGVTGTSYLGALQWADNSVHAFHWVFLFGTLYHYLCLPPKGQRAPRTSLHLAAAWFLFFLTGTLTFIHVLFLLIVIGLFWLTRIHRVSFRHLILLFSAPPVMLALHQLRVISFLGYEVWLYDQLANIRKAANLIDYRQLVEFYSKHGIIVWPSDFHRLTPGEVVKIFLGGLATKEGLAGVAVLAAVLVAAVVHVCFRRFREMVPMANFGKTMLILFFGATAWNLLFPTHASNYFNATPYVMLAGMVNLSWALVFAAITSPAFVRGWGSRHVHLCALLILVCFVFFSFQRVKAAVTNPITPIPGAEALARHQGNKFYSNIWPLYVSYYTKEWTVGGISPEDALARRTEDARWFLQRDRLAREKYAKPDYYFYVFSERMAPFAEARHKKFLDNSFPVVECGDGWCIYKM